MDQKKLDNVFLNMAKEMSSLSHCQSLKVACMIVKDNRVLSTGINGTPKGFKNCDEIFPPRGTPEFNRDEHHEFSTDYEIHSEINAIIFAARKGIAIEGATVYCTHQPCKNCLKALCNAGIRRVVYDNSYDLSGYDETTGKMIDAVKLKLEQVKTK